MSRLTAPAHPLLGVAQGGPRPAWEARLDLRLTPYLADHRVQQAAIMPAAAYLELAFAAAREAFGAVGCELRDVKLANPCFLAADKPLRLQTAFDPDAGTVQIHTRPSQGDATGPSTSPRPCDLRRRPRPTRPVFSPDAIRQRCPREFSHDAVLRLPAEARPGLWPDVPGHRAGLAGGPRIARPGRAPRSARAGERPTTCSIPALLDACLQAVIPADSGLRPAERRPVPAA